MKTRGFTLLELAVTTAVIGILAMVVVPSIGERFENARIDAETEVLQALAADIRRSFSETQEVRNIATFPGHTPGNRSGIETAFTATDFVPESPAGGHWFAKVARLRGIVVNEGAVMGPDFQQSLYHVAANSFGRARWLVAAPEEAGQQRYLLLSVMAPTSRGLHVPENDGSVAWFDDIWNNAWEGVSATLPAGWEPRLTADEIAAWGAGRGGSTLARCLVVQRIVQPKYRLIVNNTHPAFNAWVDYEGTSAKLMSAPASGVLTSEEVLAGRLIVVRRGIAAPGVEAYRFYLNEPTSISVQQ